MDPFASLPAGDLAGVVLAAGAGRRLRPLTDVRTKALCPVGGTPLVDLAIDRLAPLAGSVAVNAHHGRDALVGHLRRRGDVHVSVETDLALGTAGALARLRGWIDGRPSLVLNADGWTPQSIVALTAGWDGTTVRVLVHDDDRLRDDSLVVGCALPASSVAPLEERPSGLFETTWRPARDEGRLEVVRFDGVFVDCGTPVEYLAANLLAADRAGGSIIAADAVVAEGATVRNSVIGSGARIDGDVVDSVVWAGQSVPAGESLRRAIRIGASTTVLVDGADVVAVDARN